MVINTIVKGGNDGWMISMRRNADFCVISNNVIDAENAQARGFIESEAPLAQPFGDAASNNLIASNRMTNANSEGGGIGIYGDHNLIVGNYLSDGDNVDWLRIFGKTNIVRGNTFSNVFEGTGIGHADFVQMSGPDFGSQYNLIEQNKILNFGVPGGSPQLCFFSAADLPEISDITFRNNLFVDVSAKGTMGARNIHWYNNTFIRCSAGVVLNFVTATNETYTNFWVTSGHGGRSVNNVFLNCEYFIGNDSLGWYSFNEELTNVLADHNFVAQSNYIPVEAGTAPVGDPGYQYWQFYETNGINGGNPYLTWSEGQNFSPTLLSPLVGAGMDLSAYYNDDLEGKTRDANWDMGAYEYTETPPIQLACINDPKSSRGYPIASTNWIGIFWPTNAYRLVTMVSRREYTNNPIHWSTWSNIYSNATDQTMESGFIDTNISSGIHYEYWLYQLMTNWVCDGVTNGPSLTFQYISTGTQVPLKDDMGNLVLLVDSSVAGPLASEIAILTNSFVGDGYQIFRHDVTPVEVTNASWASAVSATKTLVQNDYLTNTNADWTLVILGHVPIPYGGLTSPGAHLDNFGAHPADWYYADRSEVGWNDTDANDSTADDPPQWNVPGDGKYDTNFIPNIPQMRLGRIDINQFPSTGKSTAQLLSQYLTRNNEWRNKEFTVPKIGTVNFSNSAPAEAHGLLSSFFGNTTNTVLTNWMNHLTNVGNATLWAYSFGSGQYDHDNTLGYSTGLVAHGFYSPFIRTYGSYYGDWDSGMRSNLFLLAPLAADGYGLTVEYGENKITMDHSAMGEPIGQQMFSMAASFFHPIDYRYRQPNDLNVVSERPKTYVSLQGDPTLRAYVVSPPTDALVTPTGSDNVITWTASSDDYVVGYHVYRSPAGQRNSFTKLTSIPTTSPYTDEDESGGSYDYMVRAVKLEQTANRSFYLPSQGAFTEAGEPATPSGNPRKGSKLGGGRGVGRFGR